MLRRKAFEKRACDDRRRRRAGDARRGLLEQPSVRQDGKAAESTLVYSGMYLAKSIVCTYGLHLVSVTTGGDGRFALYLLWCMAEEAFLGVGIDSNEMPVLNKW